MNRFFTKLVFEDVEIAAGGSESSAVIDLSDFSPTQNFSLETAVSGDGTVKIEWLGSIAGADYVEPSATPDIASGITKTSNGAGKDIYPIYPTGCRYGKIKITETGGVSAATVRATFFAQ